MISAGCVTHRPQTLDTLAALAIVGQLAMMLSSWLLPAVSEYSVIADNISELVLGRYGFVQTATFIAAGVGTVGLAFAIRALTAGSWGSFVGALLIAIWGSGAILSGLFPTEQIDRPADVWSQEPIGTIHVAASLIAFPSVIVAMLVLTRTFAQEPRWRSLTVWSGLLASGALALSMVQAQGPRVGLNQRLLVTIAAAWLVIVAVRIRSIARSARSAGVPVQLSHAEQMGDTAWR